MRFERKNIPCQRCGYVCHSVDALIEHIYDQHECAQIANSEIEAAITEGLQQVTA